VAETEFVFPFELRRTHTPLIDGTLGGTSVEGDKDSLFPELWTWLRDEYKLISVLDAGCGCGYAMKCFEALGMVPWGLEGSRVVIDHHLMPGSVFRHDFTKGHWDYIFRKFDMGWSCECGEHIPEEHSRNLVRTLTRNVRKVIAFCAAPPDCGGHNHVNCRESSYWVNLFAEEGWVECPGLSEFARSLCPENGYRGPRNYFRRSGILLFPERSK
jgi:SAM-dependent methyltransferase